MQEAAAEAKEKVEAEPVGLSEPDSLKGPWPLDQCAFSFRALQGHCREKLGRAEEEMQKAVRGSAAA